MLDNIAIFPECAIFSACSHRGQLKLLPEGDYGITRECLATDIRPPITDPQLLAFMRKVRVEADPALDALRHSFRYAMRMTVQTADGRRFERESRHRPGSPERALSAQQIHDKFRLLAGQVLSAASVDRIIDTVCGLETLDDMRRLSDRFVPD